MLIGHAATQYELQPSPEDTVSALAFAPSSGELLVSSWNRSVLRYEVNGHDGQAALKQTYPHNAPVLDVCYGADDKVAYSAGMDWQVNRYGTACSPMRFTDNRLTTRL